MGTLDYTSTAKGHIALVGHADIHNAETLFKAFDTLMRTDQSPVRLNLRGLTRIDSAGVQILLASLRHFGPEKFIVEECPPDIADTFQRLGLSGQILGV